MLYLSNMKVSPALLLEKEITESFSLSLLVPEDKLQEPTRLNYHRIVFIEEGTGSLKIDDRHFELCDQQIFLLSKGQIYAIESRAITGYSLSFGDCFWERAPSSGSNCKAVLFNNTAANQLLKPSSPDLKDLLNILETLHTEFQKPPYINQVDTWAAYLKILMIKLANIRNTEEPAIDTQLYVIYRNFLELLSQNFKTHREVEHYADLLNLNPRQLSSICYRCSKQHAKEIISGQVVAETKRLLQFSSLTLKEIAYQLHFSTPEQLSHFFKKHSGSAPKAYRNSFLHIGAR